jgi:hypothetical protein
MQDVRRVRRRQRVGDADQELRDLPPGARLHPPPFLERAAVDEFRHEELRPRVIADVVHRDDVGMIQRGCQLGFALKAPGPARVEQRARQELDRDRPVEPRVGRAVDDAHAAFAEKSADAIATDRHARLDANGVAVLIVNRLSQLGVLRVRQQRFHGELQLEIARTALGDPSEAIRCRVLQRIAVQLFDLAATFGCHHATRGGGAEY